MKSRNVTSQSFNFTQQQSTSQQQQQQHMMVAAGPASSTTTAQQQAQSSHIQVVYEPVEQSKSTDGTNRSETDTTRNET